MVTLILWPPIVFGCKTFMKKQIDVFMIITSSMEEYLFPEVHKKRDKLMSIYFPRNIRTSIEGCDRFSQDMDQGTSIWKILLFLTYVTRQCKMQRENHLCQTYVEVRLHNGGSRACRRARMCDIRCFFVAKSGKV